MRTRACAGRCANTPAGQDRAGACPDGPPQERATAGAEKAGEAGLQPTPTGCVPGSGKAASAAALSAPRAHCSLQGQGVVRVWRGEGTGASRTRDVKDTKPRRGAVQRLYLLRRQLVVGEVEADQATRQVRREVQVAQGARLRDARGVTKADIGVGREVARPGTDSDR